MTPADPPSVSVIMPIRNEATHLGDAVAAVLAQEYPRPIEVVLAVGPSEDGTEAIAEALAAADERIRVVPNPTGRTPAALNAAIEAATGDVLVRVDGHAELGEGYIRRAVELLGTTGAVNVGGIQHAVGTTAFERAVAAAMTSRFGVGDAKFHFGGAPGPTDTVYLGVFRTDALRRAGGFDESLIRNQDYELNWRLREQGGVVYFHPDLRVTYRPRGSLRGLARQYFEYGWWKREVLMRHPRSMRWRQAVPPVAVLANATGLTLGLVLDRRLLLIPGTYTLATLGAAAIAGRGLEPRARLVLPLAFGTMHHAWGAGFLVRTLESRGPRG